MSVEIDGVIYRTENQWEKRHRHVLKRQLSKGIERAWPSPQGGKAKAVFFTEAQTRPWTDAELAKEKRRRAEKREAEKLFEVEKRAMERQHLDDLAKCWHFSHDEKHVVPSKATEMNTADEWLKMGFVPISEAKWTVYPPHHGLPSYAYCQPWDVRYDPERAAELLRSGPVWYTEFADGTPYDGRPWW